MKNMCSKIKSQERTKQKLNEIEKKFKKSMVETIQKMQAANPPPHIPTIVIGEWTTSWVGMARSTKPTKPQEVPFIFPSKFIFIEEIF